MAIVLLSRSENLRRKTRDLFRQRLSDMINLSHELVILSRHIDWEGLGQSLSGLYVLDNDRSGKPIRLMVSFHYLKYTYNLSDWEVVARWLENLYWQYFSWMRYFQKELLIYHTAPFFHFKLKRDTN